MSSSQPLRSLQIDKSASPLNKTGIVEHKCQLGTTNHQNPNSWTQVPIETTNHQNPDNWKCETTGDCNHLLPKVEVRLI